MTGAAAIEAERIYTVRNDVLILDVGRFVMSGVGIHVIVGASGAGKTTLARAISGLDPDSVKGSLQIAGQPFIAGTRWVSDARPWPRVQFVAQHYPLWPHLSAMQSFALGRIGVSATEETGFRALGARLGIEGALKKRPAQMSGGERQRAAFALAIAKQPGVLILDEITSQIDLDRRRVVAEEIVAASRSMSIGLISHDLDFLEFVLRKSDDGGFTLLERGAVTASGSRRDWLSGANEKLAAFLKSMRLE